MNSPTGGAVVRGLCGDEMEFYLEIRREVIEDSKYYTEGCETTRTCGREVARRAKGKRVLEALSISPREVIDSLEHAPEDQRHCAILAVSALYRAIADYMLQP
ncbi:MAG: iron-sulfur cluster assembly scaffold protein [Deltaproteobacteria bacterium]|nr:iron-sulfur cluster assembly scaffold protein [Deltaproteobacteria bacterium]